VSLLQRYFWTQALWPLLISLASLATLALLTQSLSTLSLIVENRQSALTFFYITLLALPQLMAVIMPLAVFIAMLYTLNRLNVDSELVVAKASGFNPWQIASPMMRLATFALIAHLFLNLLLQPYAFRQMRKALLDVRTDVASQMVRPGEFVTPTPGLTVYAREINPGGGMKDVLIHDARDNEDVLTYTSKSGVISRGKGQARLTLKNGDIQKIVDYGALDLVKFDSYEIDLSDIVALDTVLRLKASDRYLHELLRPDPREFTNRKFRKELLAEGHARLATPLYNIALVLLALAFMVRGEFQRLGYTRQIASCAVFGFVIRLGGFSLTAASAATPSLNFTQYLLPTLVSAFCIWYLLNKNRAQKLSQMVKRAPNVAYIKRVPT